MVDVPLGAPVVGTLVGEHHGSTDHPKQAVGDEHRTLVAKVPVLCDVLSAEYQAVLIGVHLHIGKRLRQYTLLTIALAGHL